MPQTYTLAQKEAKKEYKRKWREDNRERIAAVSRAYTEQRVAVHRAKLDEIKLAQGCRECGYNAHPAALDFNHLDRGTKLFNIGQRKNASWDSLEAEIAKCEVLCANCHRIHSFENKHNAPRV